nr:PREDICTED: protocadherin Fat 4-like [Stegastes partitus]
MFQYNNSRTLKVNNINDNAPVFTKELYSTTVSEILSVDSEVLQVTAVDGDIAPHNRVTYSIDPATEVFQLTNSGAFILKRRLNYNVAQQYTFTVTAQDDWGLKDTASVVINVEDFDNLNPYFSHNLYQAFILENQVGLFHTIQPEAIRAQDGDTGINVALTYSISAVSPEKYLSNFDIDTASGVLSVVTAFDREEMDSSVISVSIKAAQTDDSLKTADTVVSVTVEDVNDNVPEFDQPTYSETLLENSPAGAVLFKAVVTDLDQGGFVGTLEILPESAPFSISADGTVRVKDSKALDREATESITFEIKATEQNPPNNAATASVTVTLLDENDNSPTFTSSTYEGKVFANQTAGLLLVQVAAVDPDAGVNGQIRYSIGFGNNEGYFSIDENTGEISLAKTIPLEQNKILEFPLHITATDGGVISRSSSAQVLILAPGDSKPQFLQKIYHGTIEEEQDPGVVILKVKDVNNNPPEFSKDSYDVAVFENLANGASVLTLEVTDRDEGGFVGTLRILPESAPFSIDSDGTIRVENSTALDREATEMITFEVEARETAAPNFVAKANVIVTLLDENDNSPAFTSSKYTSEVFNNQTEGMLLVESLYPEHLEGRDEGLANESSAPHLNGVSPGPPALASVEAEDPDAGVNGQIKYSIDFGNQDDYFSIDENTGAISLMKTIPLQAHKTLQFLLFITARDGGVVSRSASAQVEILAFGDSKPQFAQSTYSGTIEEESAPGTIILKVDILTLDTGIPLTLQVETEGDKFAISSTGEFTTTVKLDYDDAPHSYSVEITLTDGINSDSAVVEVEVTDVNDNSPVFTSSSVTASVPEDAEVGSNVTEVTATDKDSGFNKEIRYSLTGGLGRFSIDPVSGLVRVAAALDRETEAEYNLLVVAEDQGRPARSATATLLVQVSDINDNAPKFSEAEYQVEVLETEAVGTSVLKLTAADPDEGANGKVTYSIIQQSPSSEPAVFELESSSGTLQVVQPLDYSKVKAYTLEVQASDGGTPSLVGNSFVVVKVKDVNNNPPEFSKDSYDVAVFENLASGASIVTLEVTDRDEGGFSNGYFVYTSDTFAINNQGVVSLRNDVTLDRETTDSYVLEVVAVDQVSGGLSASAQLNVTVLDYNDNAPQFPSIPDPVSVPEGDYSEETPGELITIVPTDADLGANGEVVLSLASPNPLFRFREDGTLLAVGPLDRESRDSYDLVVRASDKGVPQRESITTIRVSLSDVNDNSPEFSSSSYVSSILQKDAEKGKLLLTLSATDADIGDNAVITYSFSEGSSPYLALDSKTGAVTLTSDLADLTEDTTLVLTAMAEDHGQPPLSATVRVVVNLRLVSLVEGVAFQSSSYNFSLPENQPVGVTVGKVWASSGSDLYEVAYTLKTHTELFSIDTSGAILTTEELDKEQQEWYILDVEAVDTRIPPTTAMATVKVQVEDVNESPQFLAEDYKGSVFSIASYRTSVVTVKATDPDVGDQGRLVYSLSADSSYFDVEPSSGLVYVVSAAGLDGKTVKVEVKATDLLGLYATAKVEVVVQASASSSDVVTISLNQPINTVEKKISELETALGKALGWTVSIIQTSSASGGATESRMLRNSVRTLVSFIAEDKGGVVSSEEVIKHMMRCDVCVRSTRKLQSEASGVTAQLAQVFGDGLHFEVGTPSGSGSGSGSDATVIALAVMLALSVVGLSCALVFIVIRFRRKDKPDDKESFGIDSPAIWSANITEASEQGDVWKQAVEQQTKAREAADRDGRADEDGSDNDSETDKDSYQGHAYVGRENSSSL